MRRTLWAIILAIAIAGCTRPQLADTTDKGVHIVVSGSAMVGTHAETDGATLTVNESDYGAVKAGDEVLVDEKGVSVNGQLRKPR